jgi:hypothetical protein
MNPENADFRLGPRSRYKKAGASLGVNFDLLPKSPPSK